MPRKSMTSNGKIKPILRFERAEKKTLKVQIDSRVLSKVEQYPAYVRETMGDEPSIDEVVERAIDKIISSDIGFKTWLKQQSQRAINREGNDIAQEI